MYIIVYILWTCALREALSAASPFCLPSASWSKWHLEPVAGGAQTSPASPQTTRLSDKQI